MPAPCVVNPVRSRPERENGILDVVEARFHQSAYLELRRVRCDVQNGVLFLAGHVSSYYLRQLAQAAVLGLEGIRAINNGLEVIPSRKMRPDTFSSRETTVEKDPAAFSGGTPHG
jgi:BON domain